MSPIFAQFLGQMWKKWKNEHMSDWKKWYIDDSDGKGEEIWKMVYKIEKEKIK